MIDAAFTFCCHLDSNRIINIDSGGFLEVHLTFLTIEIAKNFTSIYFYALIIGHCCIAGFHSGTAVTGFGFITKNQLTTLPRRLTCVFHQGNSDFFIYEPGKSGMFGEKLTDSYFGNCQILTLDIGLSNFRARCDIYL